MCKIKTHRIIKKPVILKYSYQKLKKLICDTTCFFTKSFKQDGCKEARSKTHHN